MQNEETVVNEERKYLEEQLQLLSEISKNASSFDELCKLTDSMIKIYTSLRSIMLN